MRKMLGLVFILLTAFFMTGCGSKDDDLDNIPGLELVGDIVMEVEQYSVFIDPGASILGDFDLEVETNSNVDTSVLGDYTITYMITFESNEYIVSRTVRVVEQFSGDTPGLRFLGESTMEIEQYSNYIDPGAEIIGDFGLDIDVRNNVDVNTIGTYTVVYTITYLGVDYTLTRYVEVIPVNNGSSLTILSEDCNLTDSSFDCDITYDTTGFSNIHIWAELYKDGEYVTTDILDSTYTSFGFYDLDSETDYNIKVYTNYTTVTDGENHYKKDLLFKDITTDIPPIAVVIENVIISSSTDSITVDFDVSDEGGNFVRGFLYLTKGWSTAGDYEMQVGHNTVTFDEYINEFTEYLLEWNVDSIGYGSYPTIYTENVFTLPSIEIISFEQTEMFFENDQVIMKLELDNDQEVEIEALMINGIIYDEFEFPSDYENIYVNVGEIAEEGTYTMNLSSYTIKLGENELVTDVKVSSDVPVYVLGSIAPEDATVRVIDIIPSEYYVNLDYDNESEISTVDVTVILDNPYQLPISSITIGGVTYEDELLNIVSFEEVNFIAEFSYQASPSNNNLYVSSISFTRNGDLIEQPSTGQVINVAIYAVFDTDSSDEYPDTVLISTPEDLLNIDYDAARPSTLYRLINDIDMTGYSFDSIGNSEDYFGGAFDGNGYTISNITINKTLSTSSDDTHIGFFGTSSAFLTDLTLDNVHINVTTTEDNYIYVGIVSGNQIGRVYNVNVTNSSITIDGMIRGTVGGMFGQQHGDIIGASAATDITITSTNSGSSSERIYVGGLAGIKEYDNALNSSASGDIYVVLMTTYDVFSGGLFGIIHNNGSGENSQYVENSYATGNISVTGTYYSRSGGLIGVTDYETMIINSYSSGNIYATAGQAGGLIGDCYSYVISSFATGVITGDASLGMLFGDVNQYKLTNIYAWDDQLVTRDGITHIGGNDIYYTYIGRAGSAQFNDPQYYIDFLGWSTHFFDFSNLNVSDDILPIHK